MAGEGEVDKIDPHPRSYKASGGKKMARRMRRRDIEVDYLVSIKFL